MKNEHKRNLEKKQKVEKKWDKNKKTATMQSQQKQKKNNAYEKEV